MAPARARSAQAEQPQAKSTSANGGNAANGAEPEGEGRRTATLNLPFVTAQFRKPDLHLPDVGAAAGAAAAKARSLSPAELAYYAGLGVLAVVELIEWPVALAVGAGTALARSGRNGGGRRGTGDTGAGTGAGGDRGSPGAQAEGSGQD
jgi:hypothetical protein